MFHEVTYISITAPRPKPRPPPRPMAGPGPASPPPMAGGWPQPPPPRPPPPRQPPPPPPPPPKPPRPPPRRAAPPNPPSWLPPGPVLACWRVLGRTVWGRWSRLLRCAMPESVNRQYSTCHENFSVAKSLDFRDCISLITSRFGTLMSGCLGRLKSLGAQSTPCENRCSRITFRFFFRMNIESSFDCEAQTTL